MYLEEIKGSFAHELFYEMRSTRSKIYSSPGDLFWKSLSRFTGTEEPEKMVVPVHVNRAEILGETELWILDSG